LSRLKLGVIGAGAWGRNHVRTAAGLAEAELGAVCDTSEQVRHGVARAYPGAFVTDDADALLSRVDAVVIASPARTHAEYARRAVEIGRASCRERV